MKTTKTVRILPVVDRRFGLAEQKTNVSVWSRCHCVQAVKHSKAMQQASTNRTDGVHFLGLCSSAVLFSGSVRPGSEPRYLNKEAS